MPNTSDHFCKPSTMSAPEVGELTSMAHSMGISTAASAPAGAQRSPNSAANSGSPHNSSSAVGSTPISAKARHVRNSSVRAAARSLLARLAKRS